MCEGDRDGEATAPVEAGNLVDWAFNLAARRSPPEKNADEFLRELDQQLSTCDRLVKR